MSDQIKEPDSNEVDLLIQSLLETKSEQEIALIWLVLGETLAAQAPDNLTKLITSVLEEGLESGSSHTYLACVMMQAFEDFALRPILFGELTPEELEHSDLMFYTNTVGEA